MYSKVLVLFSVFCLTCSRDITLGSTEGRKLFDEVRQANPALWRQFENVTVIAPDDELISKVVITDMRPEKDGDVQIVDGGDGKKSVTIELKSPTVLRGYEFHIEVYSVPDAVATDAEEHLSKDVSSTHNNEAGEIPNNDNKDVTQDDTLTPSAATTEFPNDTTSEHVKIVPPVVTGDINTNIRPSRETEDNDSKTNKPEDNITTEVPESVDDPTVPESSLDSITPASGNILNSEADAAESKVTITTGSPTTELNAATSETIVTTASFVYTTYTPIPYESVKNTPDYPSLNILDYIKNREAMRPIRHTDNVEQKEINNKGNIDTTEAANSNGNDNFTPLAEETSPIKPEDDTVDLVPPKVDAEFNTDFSGIETTVDPIEGSTLNNAPRAGRGINFDASIADEVSPTPNSDETSPINIDETTSVDITTPALDTDYTTPSSDSTTQTLSEDHTSVSLDDQSRNTRGANNNDASNVLPEETSQDKLANEGIPPADVNVKQPNVIAVNLDELMEKDGNRKFVYTIPLILIINSENKYPVIKIIAEDASIERDDKGSKIFPLQTPDVSLEPNEYDYRGMENDRVEKTSEDYSQ